ncbi:MAG TPA: S66 peptidase family protein [Nocardioidaceae bacterium]|nr:S66 peptidase family protein [Nocardioidaceae bacterium]
MSIRYPKPLEPGDLIGVTAPSSGVSDNLRPRLDFAAEVLRDRGYDVRLGDCLGTPSHVSAPAAQRAEELMAMLTDPEVRAVIPPWGGETAIDLLPLLDLDAIAAAEPTWFVGFSDIATLITPITLRTGMATLHGNNLMDTPYDVPKPLLSWLDVAALPTGSTFTQFSPGVHGHNHWDWTENPRATAYSLTGTGGWHRLDGDGPVDVTGRLVGGCIETLCNLAGTPYAPVPAFAETHTPDGLLVYVEAGGDDAYTICRNLHGMRLAGFFDAANAVLVGRTRAPDTPTLSQYDAVLDALSGLGVPLVADVECGHVPPYLPLVNGALGRLRLDEDGGSLTQTLR